MLFLNPHEIGKGYGKQIIQQLIQNFDVQSVDVNKDNEYAKIFYVKNGFSITVNLQWMVKVVLIPYSIYSDSHFRAEVNLLLFYLPILPLFLLLLL